jgi:hypothetical protein
MKKAVFLFLLISSLISCGSGEGSSVETKVDSVQVDSVKVDSTVKK